VPNDQESHAKIGIDWQQGYGFQFWRCTHNAYRGDGAAGQLCVVIPDQDAVIAITADTGEYRVNSMPFGITFILRSKPSRCPRIRLDRKK
jgi:hypothetical protein